MATFNIKKGDRFNLNKGIQRVSVAAGWKISSNAGNSFDVDLSIFGLVKDASGNPSFYNSGSHAVTYANQDLIKGANKSLATADGSIKHTGDNRVGSASGDCEQAIIELSQLPPDITEVGFFLTVYEAKTRKQNFGAVNGAYIRVTDQDTNTELCRYDMQKEFDTAISVQVGSLLKENGLWSFKAVGAGSPTEDLGDILGKL